jgi:uncharacterized protein YcbK (DUF882 family)
MALAGSLRASEASLPAIGRIRLFNTHTGKRLDRVYRQGDAFLPEALEDLAHFLGDHRNGLESPFDPALFDLLAELATAVGRPGAEFQVISGYRSPASNAMLSATRPGIAKHSLHMQARAIDIRLPGISSAKLRDAALGLRQGGVGYYRALDFVHVDTGPVRHW